MKQTTAVMQQNTATMQAEWREFQRAMDQRFAAIDQRFARIEAILVEHHRLLEALPDAVRDKIGFKPQQSSA